MRRQPKHSKNVLFPSCSICGKPVRLNKRRTTYYCSPACKQKAYRQRHEPTPMDKALADSADEKRLSTKRANKTLEICRHCGIEFYRDGTQGNMAYCKPACKQAAYRARKADHGKQTADLIEIYKDRPLEETIDSLHTVYRVRHHHKWRFDGYTLDKQGREYFLRRGDETLAYFQSKEIGLKFLADYVVTGVPKFAMLRQK